MKTKTNLVGTGMFLAALMNGFGQPAITKQPANQTASLFADATFRVTATGTAPLSYQWRKNGANLANGPTGNGSTYGGVTTATLTISGTTVADAVAAHVG